MPKRLRNIPNGFFAILPVVMIGASAHAGLCELAMPHSQVQVSPDPALPVELPSIPVSLIRDLPQPADQPVPPPCTGRVVQLPASPGSTQLFLSAILSLGAWQAGRSVKHIHVDHLPDWYHAGAVQVGHVTPFNFEPCDVPIARFDLPIGPPLVACRIAAVVAPTRLCRFCLSIDSPRGPPLIS